jgi:chromosome partitioning protein
LFTDALSEDPAARRFRLDDAVQRDVGSVQGLRGLDLLPSSLRLIDVQEKLAAMPLGQYYSMAPSQVLQTAIKRRLDDWDFILIDCPPNLGIITLNGLRIRRVHHSDDPGCPVDLWHPADPSACGCICQ